MKNQKIKAGRSSFNIQIGSINIFIPKMYGSITKSEEIPKIFIQIIELEDKIEINRILQRKTEGATRLELEFEQKKLEGDQSYLIDELTGLIKAYPTKVTPDFVELVYRKFVYDWENIKSLSLAKKLLNIVHLTIDLNSNAAEKQIRLRINALKVSWAIGLESDAKGHFQKAMSHLKESNTIELEKKQQFLYTLYDYGCGFNLELTNEYRDFSDNWAGNEKDISNKKIISRQCSACRYLRENKLIEAEHWLNENKNLIDKHQKDFEISSDEKNSLLAYYYFISGSFFWKKGNLNLANLHLRKSLFYFDSSGLNTDLLERGIIYYLLYKVSKEQGNVDFQVFKINASFIINNSERKNYCLYSINEILSELNNSI